MLSLIVQPADRPHPSELNEQSSILFVQLTVEDMGISIPLNPAPHVRTLLEFRQFVLEDGS